MKNLDGNHADHEGRDLPIPSPQPVTLERLLARAAGRIDEEAWAAGGSCAVPSGSSSRPRR